MNKIDTINGGMANGVLYTNPLLDDIFESMIIEINRKIAIDNILHDTDVKLKDIPDLYLCEFSNEHKPFDTIVESNK